MKTYTADFETTTDPLNCYVWAWAVCEVGNSDNLIIGTSIDSFIEWCKKSASNDKIYFHNLKFDSQFIMNWLFKNGFKHAPDSKSRKSNTFTTVINEKGLYYQLEIIFYLNGKRINKVTLLDSKKLIPLSVEEIADSFHLPFGKLSIDYDAHNGIPAGSPITKEEEEYISNDVKIVAHAINYFYSQGLNKVTIGACALDEYKKLVQRKNFNRWFPVSKKYHEDIKKSNSYRGGYVWANPKYAGKTIRNGFVFDNNSIYAYVMKNRPLPFGTPVHFKGQYKDDELYPLYTQMIRCQFEIKKNKLPIIQIKYSGMFNHTEYLTSSNYEEVVLSLNCVDLKLFFENYDVYNLEYISGWKFKDAAGLFDAYIDKWSASKIKAKEEENWGMYLISKLMLVNLYGKFGTDNKTKSKIPHFDETSGLVYFKDGEVEKRDGIYIALASFITSYAREITIRSAQKIQDNYYAGKSKIEFIYADTDSLHVLSPDGELPDLNIHQTELGAWKFEGAFNRAKFLRQKCYIEELIIDETAYQEGIKGKHKFLYSKNENGFYKLKITVAGMPEGCWDQVNFRNFKIGATYEGKKSPKIVEGGVVLQSIDFTIKN